MNLCNTCNLFCTQRNRKTILLHRKALLLNCETVLLNLKVLLFRGSALHKIMVISDKFAILLNLQSQNINNDYVC